jgi:hypothetical protein
VERKTSKKVIKSLFEDFSGCYEDNKHLNYICFCQSQRAIVHWKFGRTAAVERQHRSFFPKHLHEFTKKDLNIIHQTTTVTLMTR